MYNFLRETQVYLVESNNPYGLFKHKLPVYRDVNASQTFSEQRNSTKTLHRLTSLYERSQANSANPANFSFTVPLFKDDLYPILIYLGSTIPLVKFDLYLDSSTEILKLEDCVIETLTFNLERAGIITLSVSGTAKKLLDWNEVIPGLLQPIPASYAVLAGLSVTINSILLTSVAALNIEFNNSITWIKNNTIHDSLANTVSYPNNISLSGVNLFGSITEFLTSDNVSQLDDVANNVPIIINIYSVIGSDPVLQFSIPNITYTRRHNTNGDFITRVYDFAINANAPTLVTPMYNQVSSTDALEPVVLLSF